MLNVDVLLHMETTHDPITLMAPPMPSLNIFTTQSLATKCMNFIYIWLKYVLKQQTYSYVVTRYVATYGYVVNIYLRSPLCKLLY